MIRRIYIILCALLSAFISASSFSNIASLAFLPVTIYFILAIFVKTDKRNWFAYYGFILTAVLTAISITSPGVLLFAPLVLHFLLEILPKAKKALPLPEIVKIEEIKVLEETPPEERPQFDFDRRAFLKLIGGAGAGLFLFTLFTGKAEAAFFGSSPGPGTMSLKDSDGNKIDPAIKQPTDGYKITDVDDAASPAYYGFVNKTGAWFIQKEDSSGAYRYTQGASSYSTNWTARASLTYDYFDNIF